MPFLGLRFFKWAQLIFVSLIYAPSFPETTKNEKSNYKISKYRLFAVLVQF